MELIGLAIILGIGVWVAKWLWENEPKEKEKRKREEYVEEYIPGMYSERFKHSEPLAPLPQDNYKARYLELMETIIDLQAHPKATLYWEEHWGWRVQLEDREKLYGGGIPFVQAVSGALFEHDKFEKDPERYSMKNYCAPLPPSPTPSSEPPGRHDNNMNTDRIAEIEARLNAISSSYKNASPERLMGDNDYGWNTMDIPSRITPVRQFNYKDDAVFATTAPDDIRFLLDEVKRLRGMCQEVADKMGTTGIEDHDWQRIWIKRTGVDYPIWWQRGS